jgi:hypothetical protein
MIKKRQYVLIVIMMALVVAGMLHGIAAARSPRGLNAQARQELEDSGVNKYLGQFTPVNSQDVGDGWVKHTFDPDGGNGPICIAGTPYSVFSNAGNPAKLLIFLQGGGACWQDFYFCNILVENQSQGSPFPQQEPPFPPVGIWDFSSKDNPFMDYSIVYMPYCDGSVFSGDNDVFDPDFGEAIGVPEAEVRFHRGIRNMSAGMDLAKTMFPHASRIVVAGSSAGGAGAAGFAPFLVRFLYKNNRKLFVFNDAGPIALNLAAKDAVAARAYDWDFVKFYPTSCTDCSASSQQTAIIEWRLNNDSTIREAFYETDGDATNIFFASANSPGLFNPLPPIIPSPNGLSQSDYRELILTEHGALNAAHPDRYKRFIVSGDVRHTALRDPLFYSQTADGVLLNEWTNDFLIPKPFWVDIVEDFVPLP